MRYECQGYLHKADALRCPVSRRFGIGHGPVTMEDALARRCNVYFFHYAEQIGILLHSLQIRAGRLGLGKATGVDLPGEVSGNVPVVSTKTKQHRIRSVDDHRTRAYHGDAARSRCG